MRVISQLILYNLFFAFALCSHSVWGGPDASRKQLQQLQQRIHAIQQELGGIRDKKDSARSALRENERRQGQMANALKRLNDQIRQQQNKLEQIRLERNRNQERISHYKKSLARQVRSAHAMGRQERLKLLLNQQDPVKAGRLLTYYDYFNNARVEQIRVFDELRQGLQLKEQKALAGSQNLRRFQKQKQTEVELLARSRKARKVLLSGLDSQFQSRNNKLQQLKDDERSVQQLIRSVEQAALDLPFDDGETKSFAVLRGRLPWPVKGQLSERFGSQTAAGRLNGVLITASEGDSVRVVSDGRVVYADWLPRYGLLMIVDHGNGYMTLYAFNQSLYKVVGDRVKAGNQVATVGRSGGRSAPALYFEVRKAGKPLNPQKWCRKSRKGHVG
jgi:septal ring factor EnvC (AmiA/AmiB activator)